MAAGWEPYGDPEKYVIDRVYAGRHQRSCGAWAWSLDYLDSDNSNAMVDAASVGSQFTASECAKGCYFYGDAVYPDYIT